MSVMLLLAGASPACASKDLVAPGEGDITAALRPRISSHLGAHRDFYEGDRVSFLVTTERDASIIVLYQDAQGALTQLFPARGATPAQAMIESATPKMIPALGAQWTVVPPFGPETVWLFAADCSWPPSVIEFHNRDRTLQAWRQTLTELMVNQHCRIEESRFDLTTHAKSSDPLGGL
jgi:hypothetical protein